MNDDILKLYRDFKEETKEIRERRIEFDKRIAANNEIMYYEIYQYLIFLLKENPVKDYLKLDYQIELKSYKYVTDPLEKEMIEINPSNTYGIYKRLNSGEEILVNASTVEEKLYTDGFSYSTTDVKIIETKKKENVLKFTIELTAYKFIEILENHLLKAKEKESSNRRRKK
jgi:hypothetical protein